MINLDNQTDYNLNIELFEKIKSELTLKNIELILTNNASIQELNKTHRNIDKPTDVLSFPIDFDFPQMPIGSIVISLDYAKQKSQEYNHNIDNELTLLFIHGLLHLLGYDHEIDNGEQRAKEEELIKKFSLPESLIVRNL